jgi:nitroreductase
MELSEAIKKRRTVRKFKQDKLDKSILKELLECARLAPCGGNSQRLRYIVINTPELVDKIFELTAWAGHVKPNRNPIPGESAPISFIAVCAPDANAGISHADAGAAVQNILLKAVELGLGACWIGAFNKAKAEEILEISEDKKMLYLVALGYPDEEPVQEDIKINESTKYYLDGKDVLHVPKFAVNEITEWR